MVKTEKTGPAKTGDRNQSVAESPVSNPVSPIRGRSHDRPTFYCNAIVPFLPVSPFLARWVYLDVDTSEARAPIYLRVGDHVITRE
jgi:hypothetical protein